MDIPVDGVLFIKSYTIKGPIEKPVNQCFFLINFFIYGLEEGSIKTPSKDFGVNPG